MEFIFEKDVLRRMGSEDASSFMSVVALCLKSKGCVFLAMREQKAEDIIISPVIMVGEDTQTLKFLIFLQNRVSKGYQSPIKKMNS
ncbi:MAG: hypothetical protein SWO11_13430 [Thermodesulfobacteriota bacterium]|nr:hypothetical protein [Thermodesulfobacteriota bacterium]